MDVLRIGLGFLLLIVGSQVHWLLVGLIVYLSADLLLPLFFPGNSTNTNLVNALGAGVLAVLLSIPLQRVITALVIFLAGGLLAFTLPPVIGWMTVQRTWLVFGLGGAASLVLFLISPFFGQMVISALVGATLVVTNITVGGFQPLSMLALLFILGLAVQFLLFQYVQPEVE